MPPIHPRFRSAFTLCLTLLAAMPLVAQEPDPQKSHAEWSFDHRDTRLALDPDAPPCTLTPPPMRWDASAHGRDYPLLARQPWARARDLTLYAPRPGSADYAYNHHVYVRAFDGVLYLMHSQSPRTEDSAGQRTLMWTSRDRGDSWAGPFTLCADLDTDRGVDDPDSERPGRISYPGQWLRHDGQVYALITVDDCARRRRDGSSRHRIGRGYLARPVGPDGPTGDLFWIAAHVPPYRPEDPALIDPPHRTDPGAALLDLLRQPLTFPPYGSVPFADNVDWCNAAALAPDTLLINPTTYRLPDGGPYLRLYRNVARHTRHGHHDRQVYARVSADGRAWSAPVRTALPTTPMFHDAIWLSTGLLAYVGNPAAAHRDPLFLAFSADGLSFPAHAIFAVRHGIDPTPRIAGGHGRAGGAQQTSCAEVDGRLVVAYSVRKEDVAVTVLDLPPADLIRARD